MGKATGFLETMRIENPLRSEKDRLSDYSSLHEALSDAERREQAGRCMNCGVPFCQSNYGCPLHNLIPEWNDLLYAGQTQEALVQLLKTAPFPEFTGRVCPALCEKACMMAEHGASTNRDNELYLIETAFASGLMKPQPPKKRTMHRVAVVGSGPSGLTVAQGLNRLGHHVTVFECADRAGGLLMYGIPNMKLPKEIISRRIALMQAEGIEFRLNTEATPENTADYDAVVLCTGARKPRGLGVEGEHAQGIHFAVEYLTENTRGLLDHHSSKITAAGKHVVVVGGGDTGNDCVGTALRQGCESITQLELMPAPPAERTRHNPWPEWPRTLRTDYGQEEAIYRQGDDPRRFETTVQRIITDDSGAIQGIVIAHVTCSADGRFLPVPGSEQTIPCELMLIAAGFVGCDAQTAEHFHLPLTRRGVPQTLGTSHAVTPGLFVAGDTHTGQSLVVRAMADAQNTVREIHDFLQH